MKSSPFPKCGKRRQVEIYENPNPKQIQNPKFKCQNVLFWILVVSALILFGISNLVLRISLDALSLR